MEAEMVTTLANSSNAVLMLLLASGPLFGAGIIYMAYKLGHRFGDRFLTTVTEIAEQTKLMRELLAEMSRKTDIIENNSLGNAKRLDAIEITLKKISEELTELKIINKVQKGSNDVG